LDPKFCGPVFGMVCRLTEQKGVDLVLANQAFFKEQSACLIILGTGDPALETAVRELAQALPGRLAAAQRLDEKMSHLVEAGSDFFLMPSRFEPCGLNQMYSQAYGTLPIVTRVGGLVDTVIDLDEEPDAGTGLMVEATAAGVASGLTRALQLYREPAKLAQARRRAMTQDFSWTRAARAYEELYEASL
jgi:starch synthase